MRGWLSSRGGSAAIGVSPATDPRSPRFVQTNHLDAKVTGAPRFPVGARGRSARATPQRHVPAAAHHLDGRRRSRGPPRSPKRLGRGRRVRPVQTAHPGSHQQPSRRAEAGRRRLRTGRRSITGPPRARPRDLRQDGRGRVVTLSRRPARRALNGRYGSRTWRPTSPLPVPIAPAGNPS